MRSQRHAARTSSMAAGRNARGPGDIQGTGPASRWPVPAGRPARRRCEATRACNLRRAGTGVPGRRPLPGRQASGLAPRQRSPPSPAHHQAPDEGDPRGEGGSALFQRRRGLTGLAFCRSLKASIKSCIAWLGMSASALAWAARPIRRGWRFGGRASWTCLLLAENKSAGGRGTSASVPGYRREVSSVTMSAADCDSLASATPCPAHIESASISPVVPAIGGAGS